MNKNIKLLLGLVLLYIFINFLKEKEQFDESNYDLNKPLEVKLIDANNTDYYLVSLEQFKKYYQDIIINFINAQMPNFVFTRLGIDNMFPMPVFIIRSQDIDKYTNGNVSKFKLSYINNVYYFTPVINDKPKLDNYLYIESDYNMLVYSQKVAVKNRAFTVNIFDDINPSFIIPIQIDGMDIFIFDFKNKNKNIKIKIN